MPRHNEAPVFATQGGGYATYTNGKYVWHSEIPEFMDGAKVGDPIPEEWDIIPINDAGREVLEDDQDDMSFLEIFDDEEEVEDFDDADDYGPYIDEDNYVSAYTVQSRAYAHSGNYELAREASEKYPGDFM